MNRVTTTIDDKTGAIRTTSQIAGAVQHFDTTEERDAFISSLLNHDTDRFPTANLPVAAHRLNGHDVFVAYPPFFMGTYDCESEIPGPEGGWDYSRLA